MGAPLLRSNLKERRIEAGLQQRELARRVGVSRQTLGALEAGQTVPATSLALQLARVLGCRVEDIFWLSEADASLQAILVPPVEAGPGAADTAAATRVAIATLNTKWVARFLDADDASAFGVPADGLLADDGERAARGGRTAVRPLREREALRQNLFAAGCDPALGLLAGHMAERFQEGRLHWVGAGSASALDMLARGEVHLAGLHLFDEKTGDYNIAAVKRSFRRRSMLLVNLAVWEQGLVVARGNPRRIHGVSDLARRGIRLVGREDGTGSAELLHRLAAKEGLPRGALKVVGTARSHAAVAHAVAVGAADVGITTRAAAARHGLELLPLAEARFDLVLPGDAAKDPRLQRLLDVVGSTRFRRDLGGLTGYGTSRTGELVAEIAR
jgi:putative molybdopterin biosynthesis protein